MASSMDLRLKQRAVIEFLTAEGCSPIEIYSRMKAIYGEMCLDVSTVRRWTRRSREENRSESTVHDQARTGRPLSASDSKHQSRIDQLIRENLRVKQIDISIDIGISQERVHHIITNLLGYRKVSARWVPRMLTPQIKLQRVQICRELLAKFDEDGEDFLCQIVTGDISWVHHYDPESKQQSKEYRHKTSPSPKKFKVFSSAGKVLLTIFWDSEGVVRTEFLEQGNTVNSTKYVNTLEKLKARLRRVRSEKVSIIHHDNARPHTSLETRTALDRLGLRTLPHPPYSPDLAPSDFFLFPKLKDYLKGNRYETDEDVKNAVLSWCRDKTADFFADGIQQVVRRWRLCIERDECDVRSWGQDCDQTCSAQCLDKDCHHVTGLCSGCVSGYWGGLCDQECNVTTFGAGCGEFCSINCVNRMCHHETGKCIDCVDARIGDFCEKLKQIGGGEDATIQALTGVLVVLLLILVIVVGVFFWRFYMKKTREKQEEESGMGLNGMQSGTSHGNATPETSKSRKTANQSTRLKPHRVSTTRRKDGYEEESEEDNDDDVAAEANFLSGNTAVPMETLKAYILQHSTDSHFKDQFTSIPMAKKSPRTCGLLPENIKKNRYKNIIPYDASRVLLQEIDGIKHTNYINASHVQGYTSDTAFIASQGPSDLILNDFVRMLWEQGVDRIVMLTNLVELGKKKCSMYWPADGAEEFGDVTIRLLTTHVFAEYTIRLLRLSKSGESSRSLTQFHFTAWPDKSVPEIPWGLVDLHQRVMAAPGSGPLLVHCSAGVGRTGTFIALCNLLQEAKATGKMDFLAALWRLRQDRMYTIQTVAQYTYLHKVALVGHVTVGTTIQVKDMHTKLASLDNGSTGFYKQEFEALVEVCDATTTKPKEHSEQELEEESVYQNTSGAANKSKDRLSNILPNRAYRPPLIAEAHNEDTYINAVLVPSLTKDCQDILTQVPLPSTVTDFWRLVTQYNVGLVVAFDTDSRHTDETIGEFLPNSETEPFENERFLVETKPPTDSRLAKEFFITVHQKVVPGMDTSSAQKKRTLTVLRCKTTELDPQSILELQERIEFRRPSGSSRVVYMCRNGADQCGLMCVQAILRDRLQVDQCLTVPLVVGTIKAIRPQVIPTVDQYQCLYRVLKLAYESQNVYGNVGDMPSAL